MDQRRQKVKPEIQNTPPSGTSQRQTEQNIPLNFEASARREKSRKHENGETIDNSMGEIGDDPSNTRRRSRKDISEGDRMTISPPLSRYTRDETLKNWTEVMGTRIDVSAHKRPYNVRTRKTWRKHLRSRIDDVL
jgi:hypothetical protein